jgi:transposase
LRRLYERYQQVHQQINGLDTTMRKRIRDGQTRHVDLIRRLLHLRGVGRISAWILVKELFAWRQITSRKQLGGLVGLTPTPYTSGTSHREQGISKAGNKRLRWIMVELAWCWVQYQPDSALTQWFRRRFGEGPRQRRIGIVALARKLLIALWHYLQRDEIPAGARITDWEPKVKGSVGRTNKAAAAGSAPAAA